MVAVKFMKVIKPAGGMKRNLAITISVLAALMLFTPGIAQAQIQWQNYTLGITTKSNSLECGTYAYTGMANSKGVYTMTDYKGIPGTGVPFLQWDGSIWVLENGVGGHTDYFGTGDLPTADVSRGQDVDLGTVANRVDTRGRPNEATTEPVNVVNGGMFFDEADFGVSGAGFGLEWTRAYNSALNSTNGLGFRWSHNYDWNIRFTTNVFIYVNCTNSVPALILNMGGGSARTLLQDAGTNVWRSLESPLLTVTKTSQGEYSLPLPSGNSCLFGTNTFIKSISNAWGQALIFNHTNISSAVLLQKATHSDGRALSFSYTSNRLARVDTPSTNLCFLYYYNAGGELTGAVTRTSSGDFLTTYAYDTNNVHAMLQHQNALGEVATYAYQTNASGQVTTKCIKVDVATNYYEHTVSYAAGKTTVTYSRGNTNAVYHYYFDSNPASMLLSKIDGPNDSNTVNLLEYDTLSQRVSAEKTGIYEGTTNIQWNNMRCNVSISNMSYWSGWYEYAGIENGKGVFRGSNMFGGTFWGFLYLRWRSNPDTNLSSQAYTWQIWNDVGGIDYFMTGGEWPEDGNSYGSWRMPDTQRTVVGITISRSYNPVTDLSRFGAVSGTKNNFDSQGRLLEFFPDSSTSSSPSWVFTWNTNWDTLASATDPEGHRAEWNYTNGSVSVERIFPATNQPVETHYAYTGNGLLAGVTNGNGYWENFQYDSYGYPTQVLSAAGMTNWLAWDVLGHLTTLSLPSHITDTNDPPNMIPRVTAFEPNELGWVKKITYPDSTFETFSFDALGNVTNHIDVAGRTNCFSWLPTRKLASITRFLSAGGSNQEVKIFMDYDQQMSVLNIKDELGRSVENYKLDLQDRPVSITNVDGQVMSLTYKLESMLNSIERFDGTTNAFSYDGANRLTQVSFPDITLSLSYYNNNLIKTMGNNRGTITNSYDGANRLTVQTQPVPAGNLTYTYYPAGQLSNVASVAGTKTYTLDAGDRLQTLAVSSQGRQDTVTYSRDPVSGTLTGASYSNGIHCAYSYDLMDRLTGISWADVSNKVLRSRSYTYTAAGLISDMTFETGEKAIYSYDSLDRLTREKHTDYYGQVISDEKYEYDLAGNRTKKTILDGSGAALLNVNYSLATGNRLGSWTVAETNLATRFSVVGSSADPIGVGIRYGTLWVSNSPSAYVTPYVANTTNFYAFDMTCGMGTQSVYAAIRDVAGNTTYVTNRFYPTCLTNGTYQYSAAGCLTNRQYSGKDYTERLGLIWNGQYQLTAAFTNGALAESFGYDGAGRRIFIVEGGVTNWMVYDGDQMVAEVDGNGIPKKSYVYEGLDRAVSMTTFGAATNTYYFIRDHLGSTLALADGGGNIVESYRYDAWGRVLGVYNSAGNQIDESAVGNRILWQGREFSFKTGLYHFRARYYDPGAGRWISNDPLGIAGGLNQTCFVDNSPVNYIDPAGEGKVGIIVKTVKGAIKFISRTHALEILKSEGTVEVVGKGASRNSKKLAKEAWGKKIARHDSHDLEKGWKPHYQPKGGGGHVNYTIPGAALGVGLFGDNVVGEVVDFFNPLSDVQSVVDVLSDPSSLWSDEEGESDVPCK